MDNQDIVFERGQFDLSRVFGIAEGYKIIPPALYPNIFSFEDMRGERCGKFVFVGYLGKLRINRPGRWLVKCDCGKYAIRAAYITKRGKSEAQQCNDCAKMEHEKWVRDNG